MAPEQVPMSPNQEAEEDSVEEEAVEDFEDSETTMISNRSKAEEEAHPGEEAHPESLEIRKF